jgi:hypothetical protein
VLTDTILKGDHPRFISAKFGWDCHSSFRGEDFFFISSPLFSNLHNRSKLVLIIKPCSLTRKGYNGMPLHVMEQPPRFFALAYRASNACIYQ